MNIKKMTVNELITTYVQKRELFVLLYNDGKRTKGLQKEILQLEEELLKRGLLTEKNLEELRK